MVKAGSLERPGLYPSAKNACMQDWLKAQEIKTLYIKPGTLGRTGILKVFTTSCAMNA
jgi:hypothetical protein